MRLRLPFGAEILAASRRQLLLNPILPAALRRRAGCLAAPSEHPNRLPFGAEILAASRRQLFKPYPTGCLAAPSWLPCGAILMLNPKSHNPKPLKSQTPYSSCRARSMLSNIIGPHGVQFVASDRVGRILITFDHNIDTLAAFRRRDTGCLVAPSTFNLIPILPAALRRRAGCLAAPSEHPNRLPFGADIYWLPRGANYFKTLSYRLPCGAELAALRRHPYVIP